MFWLLCEKHFVHCSVISFTVSWLGPMQNLFVWVEGDGIKRCAKFNELTVKNNIKEHILLTFLTKQFCILLIANEIIEFFHNSHLIRWIKILKKWNDLTSQRLNAGLCPIRLIYPIGLKFLHCENPENTGSRHFFIYEIRNWDIETFEGVQIMQKAELSSQNFTLWSMWCDVPT